MLIGRAIYLFVAALVSVSVLLLATNAYPADNSADFFSNIAGEWVGICRQSNNGEQAADKYFHVKITQSISGTFESEFDYYRVDKDGAGLSKVGEAKMVITIKLDGTADCKITGKGTVLVNHQPKNQEHELSEILSVDKSGGLQGQGDGKISVYGMPLGLGKNGKIQDTKTAWNRKDDILTINQHFTISFRALLFTKKCDLNIVLYRPARLRRGESFDHSCSSHG